MGGACRGLLLSMHQRSLLGMQRTRTTTSTASGGGGTYKTSALLQPELLSAQQEFGCSGRLLNSEARPKRLSLLRPGLGKIIQHKR